MNAKNSRQTKQTPGSVKCSSFTPSLPGILSTVLILALLNISFLHLALASSTTSPRSLKANPVSTFAVETDSEPVPEPTEASHATKKDIQTDLDDTKAQIHEFVGDDPNGAAFTLISDSGLDPVADIDDAKAQLDAMSDKDFADSQGQFDKMHTRFNKRKKKMAILLNNQALMDLLHRPLPPKFRIVVSNSGTAVPGNHKVSVSRTKGLSPSLYSTKAGTAPGALVKGLAGLSVTIVPDIDGQCNPGGGFPDGALGVALVQAATLIAEVAKDALEGDAFVVAHLIAVAAWAVLKTFELVVDTLHTVYIECRTELGLHEIETSASEIKTSVGEINPHTDAAKTEIIKAIDDVKTKVGEGATKTTEAVDKTTEAVNKTTDAVNKTTDAVSASTTTITNKLANVDKNVNDSRALIISNDNSNTLALTTLSLRLLVETDLAQADNSTPLAIFETPDTKGGYLELVRSIVVQTIANLAASAGAQANSALAQGDAYKAAGNYKAAYASYRKAYKAAAN